MTHLTGLPCPPVRRGSRSGAAHRKRSATQRAGKGARPAVSRGGPPGALRTLPDAPHRAAARAYPADRRAASNGSLSPLLGMSRQSNRIEGR